MVSSELACNIKAMGSSLLFMLILALAVSDITGSVVDQSGGVVAGAKVSITQADGGTKDEVTGTLGRFLFRDLASGSYDVSVALEGFKTVRRHVTIGAHALPPLRFKLELADLQQRLTVNAGDTLVNTEAAENMDVVKLDRAAISKLPVLGNDVIGAAAQFLDAGALGAGGVTVVVDGMQTSEKGVTASAIQEVRINQNPYSAEFSRPGRGRIEVFTKPGTSSFHGAFNFIFRDSVFDARNAFASDRPAEQRRIFEGNLTGPIGRNKKTSFVMSANHEEEDLQSLTFAQTPTGEVRGNTPRPARQTEFNFKVSRQLSERTQLSVRYEFQDETIRGNGVGGFVLPEATFDFKERQHHVYVNHRTSFSPSLVNEFSLRAGTHDGNNTSTLLGVRKIVVNDAFTGGGAQADARSTENHAQWTDTAIWTRGRHLVKFGINVPDFSRRGQSDQTNTAGTYYFSSLADYHASRPYSFQVQSGDGHLALWQKEVGIFVQDEFKLRPNLSLSYGLRWDWQNFLADHNNFAPRMALAWSPDRKRKTVLRAGAGIFFDRTGESAIADTLRFDGKHLNRILITNPAYPDPGLGGESQPANIVRFSGQLRSAYLEQYSFTAERRLQKSLTLTAGYTKLRGVKSFRSLDLNSPLPPFYAARPDPAVGVLREIQSAGRLSSQAFDATLRGSITSQFKGTIQYTAGSAWNDNNGINALPADSRNLSGEWSRAPFDMRQRINLLGVVRPQKLLSLGVRVMWNTATPYTLTPGHDNNGDGVASDRPAGIPRNSMTGYGAVTLDLRWSKEFRLARSGSYEGPAVDIAFDAFNALNHVNFNNPVGNLSSPFFGQPVASKAARRVQIAMEFKF